MRVNQLEQLLGDMSMQLAEIQEVRAMAKGEGEALKRKLEVQAETVRLAADGKRQKRPSALDPSSSDSGEQKREGKRGDSPSTVEESVRQFLLDTKTESQQLAALDERRLVLEERRIALEEQRVRTDADERQAQREFMVSLLSN